MKLDELIQRVGVDNVAVQVLHESLTGAKQRRGFVEVSFGTDCVSMRDIATHEWENVVFIVSVKKPAFEAAREAAILQAATREVPSADVVDALRYRWLRDVSVPPHNFYLSVPEEFKDVKYSKAEVDAEIDKAIAASAPKGST